MAGGCQVLIEVPRSVLAGLQPPTKTSETLPSEGGGAYRSDHGGASSQTLMNCVSR